MLFHFAHYENQGWTTESTEGWMLIMSIGYWRCSAICMCRLCEIRRLPVDNSSLSHGAISWPDSSGGCVWRTRASAVRRSSSCATSALRLDDAWRNDAYVTENDGRRRRAHWRHGRHVAAPADDCSSTRWQSELKLCSFSSLTPNPAVVSLLSLAVY